MTPVALGGTCDVAVDCTASVQRVCVAGSACVPSGGSATCVSTASTLVSRCGAGFPECPSGTYCLHLNEYNPVFPAGTRVCARFLAEGATCSVVGDAGTSPLQCERGFTCHAGFCRRTCTSSAGCACGSAESACGLLDGADVCAACWSATGRDRNGRTLTCDVNAVCCGGTVCGPNGACCGPDGASCSSGSDCCGGDCFFGSCTSCKSRGASCESSPCCGVATVPPSLACVGPSGGRICCPPGFVYDAGTCRDARTDPNNCGALGNVCPSHAGTGGQARCVNGACALQCPTNTDNCDGNLANGCETDVRYSSSHCGRCSNACPSGAPTCQNRLCTATPCDAGYTHCGVSCVDTATDPNNCGGCGRRCSSGMCDQGACQGGTTETCTIIPYGERGRTGCAPNPCCRIEITPANGGLPTYSARLECRSENGGSRCGYTGPF